MSGSSNGTVSPSTVGFPVSPAFTETVGMPGVTPTLPDAATLEGASYIGRNAAGQVTEVVDADGNATTFGYNTRGQLGWQRDLTGAVTTWTYNAQGLPASQVDALDRRTDYAYDANGQLLTGGRKINADGSVADVDSYTYDSAGRLLTASNQRGDVYLHLQRRRPRGDANRTHSV